MIKTFFLTLLGKKKRLIWAAGSLCLGSGFFAGVCWFLFPMELAEISTRFQMWRTGVLEVRRGGDFHGYLRDECPKSVSPKANECACVAFIHGLGDDALSWKEILLWPNSSWRSFGLAEGMKLYAVDLPGSGGTPTPQNLAEYRVRKLALKLRQTLAGICPHWVVVGNNFGGWLAAWLALDWPSGVRRLLLLSPIGLSEQKNGEAFQFIPTREAMRDFHRKAYFHPNDLPDRVWAEMARHFKESNIPEVRQAQVEEDTLDLSLPTLEPPTLFLWGKEDRINLISGGYQMRSLLPSSIWREVSECGHLLQKECPSIIVKSIVDMINYGSM